MPSFVVAVDPPGGSGKSNAECGIVVAGIGPDRYGYVLVDLSGRMSPERWARIAVNAFTGYKADRIVADQNFGGQMVESTIRSIDRLVAIPMAREPKYRPNPMPPHLFRRY